MRKIKPTVARTPEALAKALGLSAADAKEWQVQYELKRLKETKKLRSVRGCLGLG